MASSLKITAADSFQMCPIKIHLALKIRQEQPSLLVTVSSEWEYGVNLRKRVDFPQTLVTFCQNALMMKSKKESAQSKVRKKLTTISNH